MFWRKNYLISYFCWKKPWKWRVEKWESFWHKGKYCQKYWWQSDLMWIVSVFNENWSNKCGGAPAFTYPYLHEWVPNRKLTISHLLSYLYLIDVDRNTYLSSIRIFFIWETERDSWLKILLYNCLRSNRNEKLRFHFRNRFLFCRIFPALPSGLLTISTCVKIHSWYMS